MAIFNFHQNYYFSKQNILLCYLYIAEHYLYVKYSKHQIHDVIGVLSEVIKFKAITLNVCLFSVFKRYPAILKIYPIFIYNILNFSKELRGKVFFDCLTHLYAIISFKF